MSCVKPFTWHLSPDEESATSRVGGDDSGNADVHVWKPQAWHTLGSVTKAVKQAPEDPEFQAWVAKSKRTVANWLREND